MTFGRRPELRFQAHLFVLRFKRQTISLEGSFITPATQPAHHHRKCATITIAGAIGLRTMDRIAMVSNRISWLEQDLHLARTIRIAVVGNALRETEDPAGRMGTDATQV